MKLRLTGISNDTCWKIWMQDARTRSHVLCWSCTFQPLHLLNVTYFSWAEKNDKTEDIFGNTRDRNTKNNARVERRLQRKIVLLASLHIIRRTLLWRGCNGLFSVTVISPNNQSWIFNVDISCTDYHHNFKCYTYKYKIYRGSELYELQSNCLLWHPRHIFHVLQICISHWK